MLDSRQSAGTYLEHPPAKLRPQLIKIAACAVVSLSVAFLPEYLGLTPAARSALFILVLSASLWITEAMAAFAVALLAIGLEIAILGRPGGVMDAGPDDWKRYVATWGDPLIWLFFGGFVLASAAEKTGLSMWLSHQVLRRVGSDPKMILAGCMAITFVFSMFISNTAATVMMVSVAMPIVRSFSVANIQYPSLLLGIAAAANLGGIGTIIGSPPNAIAAGALERVQPISFALWMWLGLPPALLMASLVWVFLVVRYRRPTPVKEQPQGAASRTAISPVIDLTEPAHDPSPLWQRIMVMLVFTLTVLLWMTQSFHGVPATVISFLPICLFTASGILEGQDVCALRWDVLLLIAGGLSLGLAVTETGLAPWIVGHLALHDAHPFIVTIVLCVITVCLSNLMSNTAAANILVPIALVAAAGPIAPTVIPIAISASAAMALPISTPPNAIVFGTGHITTRQMFEIGMLTGVTTPLLASWWCAHVLGA